MKDKIERLRTEEKWEIETALEDYIHTLRTRFQGPEYGTKYVHPADKYDLLLNKLKDAECVYIQNS